MAPCLQGGPWVLLTPPQECVVCEGAVFEAAGTATPQSEKGEHMQTQDEQIPLRSCTGHALSGHGVDTGQPRGTLLTQEWNAKAGRWGHSGGALCITELVGKALEVISTHLSEHGFGFQSCWQHPPCEVDGVPCLKMEAASLASHFLH